jgi:hypothetical protein
VAQDDEQQAGESRPHIDPVLVNEVIAQTRGVNLNLSSIVGQVEAVMRRQNWLVGLFFVSLLLNVLQILLGFSSQQLQEQLKQQITMIDASRAELIATVQEAKRGVQEMRSEVSTQLAATPTVTADSKGRISLEVPLDPATAKTVGDQPVVSGAPSTPDKLVIPLQPAKSRLSN